MSDKSQPGPDDDALHASAERNLPQFDDLPIAMDTARLGHGTELHPQCAPLAPLVGVWRGEGLAQYPSLLGEFPYGQQITFAHDGRPFLIYEARAWLLSASGEVLRPAAREVGWWRVTEDEIVEVVLARMRPRLAEHTVIAELPPNLPDVSVDPVQLDQVLTNLLDNAVKYSLKTIHVTVELTSPTPDRVCVRVRDQGVGIP
ncbi:MAG: heme-binding beta-barrel domain-containing protein, partial [Pseudonocardiaceae bacterium]